MVSASSNARHPPKTPLRPIQTAQEIYSTPVEDMSKRRSTLLELDGHEPHPEEGMTEEEWEDEGYPMGDFEAEYEADSQALYCTVVGIMNRKRILTADLEVITKTKDALVDSRTQLTKQCHELEKTRENDKDQKASLKKKITDLETKYQSAIKEGKRLSATNSGLETLLEEAVQKLQETPVVTTHEVDLESISTKNDELEEQISLLTAQLAILKKSTFNRPAPEERGRSTSIGSSRSSAHSSTKQKRTGKEPNVKDPIPLTNGKEPSFENWEKAMKTLFNMKFNTFAEDGAKMGTIWNLTGGMAQQRLEGRYMADENRYITSDEMMADLRMAFIDPNKQQTAKIKYNKLQMEGHETFSSFEQSFHRLATHAKIPMSVWREDLLEKVTIDLQGECIVTRDGHMTYQGIKEHLETIDQRRRIMKTRSMSYRTQSPAPPAVTFAPRDRTRSPGIFDRPRTPSAPLPFVTTKTADAKTALTPNIKCFNCKKVGHYMKDCSELKATVSEMTGTEVLEMFAKATVEETASGNAST